MKCATGVSVSVFCWSNANLRLVNTLQVVGMFLILLYAYKRMMLGG